MDHGIQVINLILERVDAPNAGALIDTVERGIGSLGDADSYWDPTLGDLHAHLAGQHDSDAVTHLAGWALLAHGRGVFGEWEAPINGARLRVADWVLPPADHIEVRAGPDAVVVHTHDRGESRRFDFDRQGDGWTHDGSATPIPTVAHAGFSTSILAASALSPGAQGRLLHADAYDFDPAEAAGADAAWSAALVRAAGLLHDTVPDYVDWTSRVLKYLLPLRARAGTLNSGGERFSPGVVSVSDQPHEWPLAEMLVHESAHQYMNTLLRLGPLEDGSDDALYHSPFRGRDRPIFFILVAYHAFANVLIFYERARAVGRVPWPIDGYPGLERREATLRTQVRSLEPVLESSPAITGLGHGLWRPLQERLDRGQPA